MLDRLRVKPAVDAAASTTKLGDWYADTLNLGHERLVLCVSERTLLPVIVPAAGPDLPGKLRSGLRELLEALQVPREVIDAELAQMREATIAKTASRVVLGSMNEFQFQARAIRDHKAGHSPLALEMELAEMPCSPIGWKAPLDAVHEAFGLPPVHPR